MGALRLPFNEMTPCLLYADDDMFFIKPEVQQLQALQIALTVFKQVSGLSVNLSKSELMVSMGTHATQQQLTNVLGCRMATLPFTYLGLPLSNCGLMDLSVFNQALLIKWFWQWRKPQRTLCKSLFQQHIASNGLPDSPIFTLAISKSLPYCQFFFSHKIGNGKKIQLWNDNWEGQILSTLLPDLYTHALDTQITLIEVSQISNLRSLFRSISSDMANQELVQLQFILSDLVLNPQIEDDIKWKWNVSGQYTVQAGYRAMKDGPRILNGSQRIWKLQAPPRMKVFGWLALNNRLLTIDNLNKRGWPLVNRCVLCRVQGESIKHMLDECNFSKSVYSMLANTVPAMVPNLSNNTPPTQMLTDVSISKIQRETMLIMQFIIWRERCARTFSERGL
ncbi:uncharacterized protein LOC144544782 [Carex rostrata]